MSSTAHYSWCSLRLNRLLIPAVPLVGLVTLDRPFLPHLGFLIHQMGIMLGLPLLMGNKHVKKCKVFSTEQGT